MKKTVILLLVLSLVFSLCSCAGAPQTEEPSADDKNTIAITVTCASVLDNMDKLKNGKESFIPSDGIILSSEIKLSDGLTAFDALKTACDENDILFEYEYTPTYGSYYIEGINQLYSKDCGEWSGWLFKVNGETPLVGCSEYELNADDSVEFYFSCDMMAEF